MKRFPTILSLVILALACQKQPSDVPIPTPDPEPKPEVVTLSLTPKSLIIEVGETQQLTATVSPAGKSVYWSSGAPEIASVAGSGKSTQHVFSIF